MGLGKLFTSILLLLIHVKESNENFYCHGYAMCPEACFESMLHLNDACISCQCPRGYKRPLYYDLKECKHGKCTKSNETCKYNYCQCANKFVRVPFIDEPECRPMPKLGDNCFIKGRRKEKIILPCGITPNVDSECHVNLLTDQGKCECKEGYQNVQEKNEHCIPIMNFEIGSSCTKNSECSLAYSTCNSTGQCACRNGYQISNDVCHWPKRNCPYEDGRGKYSPLGRPSCVLKYREGVETSNCSLQSRWCFSDRSVVTPGGYFMGFCCPIPMEGSAAVKLACLQSDLQSDRKCSLSMGRLDEQKSTCNPETHVCVHQKYRFDSACCVKPCNIPKAINVLGKCVLPLYLGEQCLYGLQCPLNAECNTLNKTLGGIEKFCICMKGYFRNQDRCVSLLYDV